MVRKKQTIKLTFACILSLTFALCFFHTTQQSAWCLENIGNSEIHRNKGNKTILEGIDLLYNREFDGAEVLFQKLVSESPNKPAGHFYLAMVTWSRMVTGFWTPEIIVEYKKRIDRTIQVAKRSIKYGAKDSYDYFYMGGALGFQGRYELMKRNWFTSFLISRKAIKALKKCIKMDTNNKDVFLGLGTFDYYTARFSGILKFLTYFFVHKGNIEDGLRKLHIAAEEATFSKTEAKSVLLHIYLYFEEDYSQALNLARVLGEKYSQDPTYRHFEGVACIRLGLETEYMETLNYMYIRSQQAQTSEKALLWQRRALYLASIYDLFHFHYPEARSKLKTILTESDPKNDPAMIAWPLIKIGLTFDFEGDRETAKGYYQKVLDMENASGAQFMAEKCLGQCPGKKDPKIGY